MADKQAGTLSGGGIIRPTGAVGKCGTQVFDQFDLPDIEDLASRLRFSPKKGRIWLDNNRMILMHTRALGALRRELVETLGMSAARALLIRMGYASGAQDAELAVKVRGKASFTDFFLVGPQLHALEGIVNVEPIRLESDSSTGHFYGEFLWHDSAEDEVHIENFGFGSENVCWMQQGYASGYTSVFVGRPVLFREVECRATGAAACRIIGKPVSEWDITEDELRYLQPQAFANRDKLAVSNATAHGAPSSPLPAAAAEAPAATEKQLVGASAGFNMVCHMLEKVAGTNATVLLLGESGVGKELFAQTLHRISKRSTGPFVAINCAAIPEHLIESELFGVEKGAFTGATESRAGRFERAHGGTLFLDEIGTLTLQAQGKLLRALQEGEVERVGDRKSRKVDVRVVAATNVNLRDCARRGTFREDLFFRLNVFPIQIPSLRERRADIPLLMEHFLNRFRSRHGKNVTGFTQRAINGLFSYDWPGNIRELENMIERGVILASDGEAIDLCHLFTSGEMVSGSVLAMSGEGFLNTSQAAREPANKVPVPNAGADDLIDTLLGSGTSLDDLEERLLHAAVERAQGNISEAARMLGITRPQLAYRLKRKVI